MSREAIDVFLRRSRSSVHGGTLHTEKKISPDGMKQTGDDIRTELAYIRTGLAAWGVALIMIQKSWIWIVFFLLGTSSIWRARNSIL
jgi:hypothetical protein